MASSKECYRFPFKLYNMLEYAANSEHASAVSWIQDGRAFAIHNKDEFLTRVVPRFFKQTKYRSFTRQLNLWGFDRFAPPGAGACISMAWRHKHFVRGRVDGLGSIIRTETKSRCPANGKLDPPRRPSSEGKPDGKRDGKVRVIPSAVSSPGPTPTSEKAVVPVSEETHRDAPPTTVVQHPNSAFFHPLLPDRKFTALIRAAQTMQPHDAAPVPHAPPKCSLHASIQGHIRGDGANVAQLPSPSKRPVLTHDRDSHVGSGVDITQLLRNSAVHDVWRQHPTQQQQQQRRPRIAGVGGVMRDEEDILFLLSRIIESAENGADISSVPPFLNVEESDGVMNPISF